MQKAILFLLAALCYGQFPAAAQDNLIKNPDFEDKSLANGLPGGGWWFFEGKGHTTAKVDSTTAHSGKTSFQFHADEDSKCVLVSAPFDIAPGDELKFRVWVKAANIPTNHPSTYAGLAFRRLDGTVFKREYFTSAALNGDWALVSGTASAPAEAITAEVHLGYTNAPGTIWFDDITAAITSAVSLSLVEAAKPWPGPQEITLRVVNRQTTEFRGSIVCAIGKEVSTVPVHLKPKSSGEFKIPINLKNEGEHAYKIRLLDGAGTETRVLQGKFRTAPALALYPPCPYYQLAGAGKGETRIDANINLNPLQRAGLKLKVELLDAAGNQIQSTTTDASQGERTGVNVRVPLDKPAVYEIVARLMGADGQEIGMKKSAVHVAPDNSARVTTGPDGFLLVNGVPHFPLGIYNSGREEEMGRAGFNATHNYNITIGEAGEAINPTDSQLKDLLDKSWANGLRMMVELPRKAIEKARWEQIRRRVETFKHHPGLLCWGSEERVARGNAPLANIAQLYALVHELDPDHPFVLGDTCDVIQKLQVDRRNFFPDPDMDAGIWWWYPIPLKDADGNGLEGANESRELMEPPSWLTTTLSKKPLWIAIQSYQKPTKDAPFPTPEEYRCQSYLSIINGVKGLFFYVGYGQRDFQGKSAGLLNKPVEAHWDYVQKLAGELRDFSPVIMAPSAAEKLLLSPADTPLEFALRQSAGKIYLLAANKSGRTRQVRFQGDWLKGKRARVLFEEHPVTVNGDALADEFPPFGVHVYQVE